MTKSDTPTSHKLLELLPKLSNYLIGITIICYGAGFAITNLYLGSMGIVTFDILRSRYILAGLLFLFFLGAIAYLVFGLFQTLRKHHQQPRIKIIGKVLWFSYFNLGVLYFMIPAIGLFAGSYGSQSYNVPQPTQPNILWSDWLNQAPLSILRSTALLFLFLLVVIGIFIAALIIINPKNKDGKRTPRRQILKEAFQKIKESKGEFFGSFLGLFIFLYLLNILSSAISFFLAGKVSMTTKLTISLPSNWALFFNTIAIIYALIAVYLTFVVLYNSSSTVSSDDDTVLSSTSSLIYFVSAFIVLVVPLYAIRVYPALPQQIGGGQLLKVQVILSDKTIEPQFEDQNIATYLIDRTSNTSFFVLQNTSQSEYKIIEIQNDAIQSIIYTHFP